MKHLALLLCLLLPSWAMGATYYVWEGGSATKANAEASAGGTCSATHAMPTVTHNASTFVAGDTIYLCDGGGPFALNLPFTVPSSGASDGSRITYANAPGNSPVIAGSSTARAVLINGKSWVTWDGINVTHSGNPALQSFAALTVTGFEIKNCNISGGTTGGYALNITGTSADITNVTAQSPLDSNTNPAFLLTPTTLVVNGITVGASNNGVGVSIDSASVTANNISIPAGTNTKLGVKVLLKTNYNISGSNWSVDGGDYYAGVNLVATSAPTGVTVILDHITSNNNTNSANGITIEGAGTYTSLHLSNVTANSNAGRGISIAGVGSNLVIDGTNATNDNVGNGFDLRGSAGPVISGLTALRNGVDGISFGSASAGDAVTGATVSHSVAAFNGTVSASGNGDGFTSHEGCTGNKFLYCIAYKNKNTGHAHVLTSSGEIYNNTVAYNGDAAYLEHRSGMYFSTAANWTIKNNVIASNYPYEVLSGTGTVGAGWDNNLYYHVGNGVTESSFASVSGGTVRSWAQYHTTDASEPASIYGDALFRDTSANDYRLTSSSPAVNAATDLCATLSTATDIAGVSVCSAGAFVSGGSGHGGTGPDIGPYELPWWTLSPTAGAGGSVSPSGATNVADTASQAFTFTPSAGYRLSDVTVDSVGGQANPYTFSNVTTDHTISGTFQKMGGAGKNLLLLQW